MADAPASSDGLRRELGLFGAVSMIVGIVIGSGIFLGVNRVAAGAGAPWLVVLVWVVGGLLTLMGALCYAELGVLFPRAGGEYVFLREALGPLLAFLSGWAAFTINLAGSAAALADIFARQLNALKPAGFGPLFGDVDLSVKFTGACLIAALAVLNYFGLRYGAGVQKTLTVLKGGLMVGLAVFCLLYAGAPSTPHAGFFETVRTPGTATADGLSFAGFLAPALVAALFAYDGWTNVVRVGSELRDPARNLPRAMLLGLGTVMLLYTLLSLGYLNVLGFTGFAASPKTVATDAARVLFGSGGQAVVAALILVSVFGSLNGITISGPRIYFAMARDGLFPRRFGDVNRHAVPGKAVFAQAALSIAFLFFFDFDKLTDNVVFISFIFYGLAAFGLLRLRKLRPDLPRPYKVPFYPWLPAAFMVLAWTFSGYLLVTNVLDAFHDGAGANLYRLAAVLVVALGVPVYLFYKARGQRPETVPNA
jgi:amino acid transporter